MNTIYRSWGKRLLELLVVIPTLILLLPLIVLVALFVRWRIGAPVLFRQERGGYRGRPFRLAKFRTMRDAFDEQGMPLPDEQRLTRFGRALRKSSLDELPQLWNVLTGTMSLIGPRPLLVEYLNRYSHEQARRHEVRPGITGWAQVHGRNALTWEERFRLDTWYVDHLSLWLDLQIVALTLIQILRRSGVSAEGHATMPKFMGSDAKAKITN